MNVQKQKIEIFKLCENTVNILKKDKNIDEDTATTMVVNAISLCNSTNISMIKMTLKTLIEIA